MGAFDIGRELSDAEIEGVLQPDYQVQIGEYFSQGWKLFTSNTGNLIGFMFLSWLISAAFTWVPFAAFLLAPLTAGYYTFLFRKIKGEQAEFGDFFKGYNYFLPIALSSLVMGIFLIIGTILLVLPAIYLGVAYLFVIPLIVDKEMHFWQAMETSRKLIGKKWFSFFGLIILLALLNLAGALALLIGLLVTIPWTICIMVVTYADIVGLRSDAEEAVVISS
jgi:uncharacterized membrane protein